MTEHNKLLEAIKGVALYRLIKRMTKTDLAMMKSNGHVVVCALTTNIDGCYPCLDLKLIKNTLDDQNGLIW